MNTFKIISEVHVHKNRETMCIQMHKKRHDINKQNTPSPCPSQVPCFNSTASKCADISGLALGPGATKREL